ncbi:MAG: ABC transporter permease, partial [Gammaproteobacteria bacterium]|nr:ABC transporter permease [Gammaproteobacteria bacterium]
MRHFLSQFVAVATLSVRTLPARLATSLMTLVGIAGVVAALLVVLSIAAGLEEIMQVSGTDNSIVVLRLGSENEMSSSLELETVRTISQTPGIRRD